MRANIKTCVSGISSTSTDAAHVAKLESENKSLKKLIDDLSKQVSDLTLRVGKLEGGSSVPVAAQKTEDKDEDEDDFELFGSDEDEEEETEEEKEKKKQLLDAYHARRRRNQYSLQNLHLCWM